MKATHKTHKTALYARDWFTGRRRPVKMVRPTLRQIEVTIRKINKGLRNAQRALRSADAAIQLQGREALAALYKQRDGIDRYIKSLA